MFNLNQHLSIQSDPLVLEELLKALRDPLIHGKRAKALEALYQLVGAHDEDRFALTASSAEAIAQVYHSVHREFMLQTGRNHILRPQSEIAAIQKQLSHYEALGCVAKAIPLNAQGQITKESLDAAISPRTALLSLSWANPITGVVHPIWDIAELCHERGVMLHVEATAALGKLYFRFQDLPIDYLTFDGAALGLPFGAGALFAKRGAPCASLIEGRSEALPFLSTLGKAASLSLERSEEGLLECIRQRDAFESELSRRIPGATPLFTEVERLPHVSVIAFPDIHAESLLFYLNHQSLLATLGGGVLPSVLESLSHCQIPSEMAQGALSFAFNPFVQERELQKIIDLIVSAAQKLRAIGGRA